MFVRFLSKEISIVNIIEIIAIDNIDIIDDIIGTETESYIRILGSITITILGTLANDSRTVLLLASRIF